MVGNLWFKFLWILWVLFMKNYKFYACINYTVCHENILMKLSKLSKSQKFKPSIIVYLSVLKPGSNTRRGSNIHWVVQQNERNKRLGPFKCQVPKLLNLINLKMVPNIKENYFNLNISLDVCISLSDVATVDIYSIFITFVIFPHRDAFTSFTTPVSE